MIRSLAVFSFALSSLFRLGSVSAQAPYVQLAQTHYIKVDAPFAQQLILAAKAAHPELKKIGLHAVPPGGTESAIVANAIPGKIGKVSSPNDLTVVATGQPKVYPHPEEGGFFDLGLPLTDAQHRPIGMMVMEIPYKDAATEQEALAKGLRIRDEITSRITSKQALFQPAPQP